MKFLNILDPSRSDLSRQKKILVIGAANSTREIIEPYTERSKGNKYLLDENSFIEHPGGGGFNYAARLLSLGINVIPILPIADDSYGDQIRESLMSASIKGRVNFNSDLLFFMNGEKIRTPSSTIIKQGTSSKIYIEISSKVIDRFPEHCRSIIKKMPSDLDFIIIGHIHSDYKNTASLTKEVINYYHKKQIPIFANFGLSQISYGFNEWKSSLSKLDLLQLNIDEVKALFFEQNITSIDKILGLFRGVCTIAITLGELGAIIQMKKEKNALYIPAYKLKNNEITGTVGAGDAFGAGLLSYITEKKSKITKIPLPALSRANICAAQACTMDLLSYSFPDFIELNSFAKEHNPPLVKEIDKDVISFLFPRVN